MQAAAPCVTVTVCPATVNVPVRGCVSVLASMATEVVPVPVPLAPPVTLIHDAFDAAAQAHPAVVVTFTVNAPPVLVGDSVVGATL